MDWIEALYYGNVCPMEQGLKDGSAAFTMRGELLKKQKQFTDLLSDEQKNMYNALADAHNELWCELEKEKFVYGFQLGVQLLVQALNEPKSEI